MAIADFRPDITEAATTFVRWTAPIDVYCQGLQNGIGVWLRVKNGSTVLIAIDDDPQKAINEAQSRLAELSKEVESQMKLWTAAKAASSM